LEDAAWSIRLDTNEVLLFLLALAESRAYDFGSCDDLPVTYIIVSVLNEKPGRKRLWIGWPAEG
jgi:hypothetical protein